MNKLEFLGQLDEKIVSVVNLLNELDYEYDGIILTEEERKKLFDFTFKYKGCRLNLSSIIEDIHYPEYVARLNASVAINLTPEVETIITKCGVDPHRVFVFADSSSYENNTRIDPRLYAAMYGISYAVVDNYCIRRTIGYPGKNEIDYAIRLSNVKNQYFPLIINSNNAVLYNGFMHQTNETAFDDSDKIEDYQVTYDCLLNVEEALRRKIDIDNKSKNNKKRFLDRFKGIIKRG